MTLRSYFLAALATGLLAARLAGAQPTTADKVYTDLATLTMPQLSGPDGAPEEAQAAVQRLLQLPPGTAVPPEQRVFVRFVVEKDGTVTSPLVTQRVSPEIDAAVLAAVRRLPRFRPGQHEGRPVRVAVAVAIWPGGVPVRVDYLTSSAADDSTEARTLRRGTARRYPDEAAADFLARVLPASFGRDQDAQTRLVTYSWQASSYGPQLFFDAPDRSLPVPGLHLFVAEAFAPNEYALQVFDISMADYTTLDALFFADANQDGQKDLLALVESSLREEMMVAGRRRPVRRTHYETSVFYRQGPDAAGRPQYEQQYMTALDGLRTAAEVRQALGPARPRTVPAAGSAPARPAKK